MPEQNISILRTAGIRLVALLSVPKRPARGALEC